jgi:glycosyltransferase involved in cell wall biosynthesis
MLDVLVLSTWYPYPLDNGSRIRAYYLLRALSGHHQVTLVAFDPAAESAANAPEHKSMIGAQIVPVADDPYQNTSLPAFVKYLSPIPVVLWPSRAMAQTVSRLARESRWDAVVALQSPVARYALRVPALARIFDVDAALSHTMYGRLGAELDLGRRIRAWVSWQKAQWYEAALVRRFDVCAVASAHDLDYLRQLAGGTRNKVVLVPNGVDCERNRPGVVRPAANMLVFNGALTYSANYDAMRYFLSEIFPLIHAQEPGAELTITGSTQGVDVSGLRLDSSVRLAGYLDDVRAAVAGASVCVVPMRDGGGTRLKILEAMALGTAVVATSKGAEGLEVTHRRDILIAEEPADFAAQVVRLLRDPGLGAALAANARQLVERRYDWSPIGQRFVTLVEGAASQRSSS